MTGDTDWLMPGWGVVVRFSTEVSFSSGSSTSSRNVMSNVSSSCFGGLISAPESISKILGSFSVIVG